MRRCRCFVSVAALATLAAFGASGPARAQSPEADRLAADEKVIQALQAQVEELRQEVAALRSAPAGGRPAGGPRSGPEAAAASAARVQPFGYLQSQFETGPAVGASRFLVRRARLGLRGQLERGFDYEAQVDAAAGTAILRNAFIDAAPWRGNGGPALRFGQFKLPYSLEAIESSTTLPVIERALVVEQLGISHDRDVGIALLSPPGARRAYAYQLSLTNGAGRNQFASTRHKLFAGRVQINTLPDHPLLGGRLSLGFSTRQGRVTNLDLPRRQGVEDERYGVDLDYLRRRWHLRGEYLWGRDQALKPHGYYGLGAYQLAPALQLVARYEGYRADEKGPGAHRTTLGLNYAFSANTRALLDVELLNGRPPNDLRSGVRLRLQTVFP